MASDARVFKVAIASPGDVKDDRNAVREAVHEWNSMNSDVHNIIFMPVMWEHNSVPDLRKRAQSVLNETLIHSADALIALFWTRLGTPTGNFPSGTVEEIKEFMQTGRPIAMYFSKQDPKFELLDAQQFQAVKDYKSSLTGYHRDYASLTDLKSEILKYLTHIVKELVTSQPKDTVNTNLAEGALEPNEERQEFLRSLGEAAMASAAGYWLSIVCDYGSGYTNFQDSHKRYIWNWCDQLRRQLLPHQPPTTPRFGRDFARYSVPKEDIQPRDMSVLYTNTGIAKVQWRGDSDSIPLSWVLVRCVATLDALVRHSVVDGVSPKQIGFAVSNAPKHGVSTSGVFRCLATQEHFQSLSFAWKSTYGQPVEVDSLIREFVRNLLEEWGYMEFEQPLNALPISGSISTLLLIENGFGWDREGR